MSKEQLIADQLTPIVTSLVGSGVPLPAAMKAIEMKFIDVALVMTGGNIRLASQKLGIHRNTLMNKRRRRTW